jgi:16S rRNA (cytidine1402-2'-O)-methyltransferase
MKHFDINTPMASHHKFNEHETSSKYIDRIVAGENIALVSDAGTPGISDPGFMLSRECRRRDVEVETLPGATAFVPALVNSGLPCDRFVFEGFLPQKKGRATRLAKLAEDDRTFIIYESPLRLAKTLAQLAEVCGDDRQAAVCREISKLHNTTERDTLGKLRDYYTANQARGEIVIIVSGKVEAAETKVHKNKYRSDDNE